MKQADFAKKSGASRQLINKMVRQGRLIAVDGEIDPENPVNAAFLSQRQMTAAASPGNVSDGARRVAEALASAALRRQAQGLPDLVGKVEPSSFLSILASIEGRDYLVYKVGFAEPLLDEVYHEVGAGLPFAVLIDLEAEALTRADDGRPVPSKWIRSEALAD